MVIGMTMVIGNWYMVIGIILCLLVKPQYGRMEVWKHGRKAKI